MSTQQHRSTRGKRRRATQLHGLDEQPKPLHKAPSAQDAFIAWLLWLPSDADPRLEALQELERMARRNSLPPEAIELEKLLQEVASSAKEPI